MVDKNVAIQTNLLLKHFQNAHYRLQFTPILKPEYSVTVEHVPPAFCLLSTIMNKYFPACGCVHMETQLHFFSLFSMCELLSMIHEGCLHMMECELSCQIFRCKVVQKVIIWFYKHESIPHNKIMAQASTRWFCWWSCVDSQTPAASDKAWVVPSLPNIRLKLLLPSPLVSFPPLSSSDLNPLLFFHYISFLHLIPPFLSSCLFYCFFSHFFSPHCSISLPHVVPPNFTLHPPMPLPPSLLFA